MAKFAISVILRNTDEILEPTFDSIQHRQEGIYADCFSIIKYIEGCPNNNLQHLPWPPNSQQDHISVSL